MNAANLSSWTPLANHLWQSTVFAAAIWLLTLGLRKNRAAVRYWLWFAASVKFLIPFFALVALGSQLSWRTAASAAHPPRWSFVADNAIQPFTAPIAPAQISSPHASFNFAPILIAVWLCGVAVGVAFWLKCWTKMRRIRKDAVALPLGLPVPVLSSPSQIEPGVFGILKPVLLLPVGIESRLTPEQLDAILAHEMAHVRRRDNLTAAIHMLVEIVFWFFPVAWWLRARLIEERELACDEAVLGSGGEAESYAEGIIQVCKSYVESPVVCISGISGADLKKRILVIVSLRRSENLTRSKKLVLAAIGVIAVLIPLAIGLANAPLLRAQSSATDWEKAAGGELSFDVASVKANKVPAAWRSSIPLSGDEFPANGGRLSITSVRLTDLITFAYKLDDPETNDVERELPRLMSVERFDIDARAPEGTTKDQMRLMMQSLLEERFKLKAHFEAKEEPIFNLVLIKAGKSGPELRPHAEGPPCDPSKPPAPQRNMTVGHVPIVCRELGVFPPDANGSRWFAARDVNMQEIAYYVAMTSGMNRRVIDETGLTGTFDFLLNFSQATPAATDEASPVDSGPIFSEALKNELGLKLEPGSGPVESLVIDHIEEPTPN